MPHQVRIVAQKYALCMHQHLENSIPENENESKLVENIDLFRKKRKFELARPPAMTKLAPQRIHTLRTRGGNKKYRALRLPPAFKVKERSNPI